MSLVLACCVDDPHRLWEELQAHWGRGALVGLAPEEERDALLAAVLAAGAADNDAAEPVAASGSARGGDPAMPPWQQAEQPRWSGDAAGQQRITTLAATIRDRWGPSLVLGSGGSSGGRRWCLQPLSHLRASAGACASWLASQGIDPERCLHLDALPLHHVSGLMPLVRSRCWSIELRWLPPVLLRQPEQLPLACPLPRDRPVLLSLVPTQLQRLIDSPAALRWLRSCAVIWVGGAALPADLARRARAQGLPLAPCYGATETAAMVCALPPQRFLAGEAGCGPALADVELRLEGTEQAIAVRTARLSPGWFEAGRLRPFSDADGWWRSGDAGVWQPRQAAAGGQGGLATASGRDGAEPKRSGVGPAAAAGADTAARGRDDRHTECDAAALHAQALTACPWDSGRNDGVGSAATGGEPQPSLVILGRLDGAIHSGGETVFPDQVRQQLLGLIRAAEWPVAELLLLAEPDALWGERLVALVRWRAPGDVGTGNLERPAAGSAAAEGWLNRLAELARELPAHQRPRRWLTCPELEPTCAGKWEWQRWKNWLKAHDDTKT